MQAPVQLLHEAPDMPRVVPDARLAGDDRGQAREGPQVRAKPKGQRPLPEGDLHRLEPLPRELRFPSRAPGGPERLSPPAGPVAPPAQNALAAGAKSARDLRVLELPGCKQPGRREATPFQGVEIPSRPFRCTHAIDIARVSTVVTIFYEIQ